MLMSRSAPQPEMMKTATGGTVWSVSDCQAHTESTSLSGDVRKMAMMTKIRAEIIVAACRELLGAYLYC